MEEKKEKKMKRTKLLIFLFFLSFASCGATLKTSKIQKETDKVVSVTAMASACLQAQTASKDIGGNPAFCQTLLDIAKDMYVLQINADKLRVCMQFYKPAICYQKIYKIEIAEKYLLPPTTTNSNNKKESNTNLKKTPEIIQRE